MEVLSLVADGNVAEQDGLGEGACIAEAITRLFARDNAIQPSMEVILAIRKFVCVVCEFFLWVQFGSSHVRDHKGSFIPDK